MIPITRKIIADILDKMEIVFTIVVPKKGTEMYDGYDTMFMITKDNNLIYFTDFEVTPDNTCVEVSGKMFFMTPSGDLSGDFVELNSSLFIRSELNDYFVIVPQDEFDYTDLDRYIREIMKGHNVSGMSFVEPENKTVPNEEFIY